jgi:hypothetical protein
MEFACRNLGQPPFGLMTPTKQVDLVRLRSARKPLPFCVELRPR